MNKKDTTAELLELKKTEKIVKGLKWNTDFTWLDDDVPYLVTDGLLVYVAYISGYSHMWESVDGGNIDADSIKAWLPLPEPYGGATRNDEM